MAECDLGLYLQGPEPLDGNVQWCYTDLEAGLVVNELMALDEIQQPRYNEPPVVSKIRSVVPL